MLPEDLVHTVFPTEILNHDEKNAFLEALYNGGDSQVMSKFLSAWHRH